MASSPNVSLSRLRLFLAPHAGAPPTDRPESPRRQTLASPSSDSVATVTALNPLTKEFQRVRYLLQASLPGYRVPDDDVMIWDMQNPALSAQYEQATGGLLELDSWVAVEDLGPSIEQVYSYGFHAPHEASHAMKLTTGNITMDQPGKKGKKQYVLCKVATGRSMVIEDEAMAAQPLPPGYDSYYIVPKAPRTTGYCHEYIVTNTQQILPQYLVRFGYQWMDPKLRQRLCALCELLPAAVACRCCEAELCAACDHDTHAANKLMSRHARTPLSIDAARPTTYVGQNALHDTKHVEFYCPVCAVPVCVNCKMVGDHSCGEKGLHRLISIPDAYEQSLKESNKVDPLVESRKMLIGTRLGHITERVNDVKRNRDAVEMLLRSTLDAALATLEAETSAKLRVLRCEELELSRQVQQIAWADEFLALQRQTLPPVAFLSAWHEHKPLRIEQRDFPVANAPSYESVKPDLQLVGRLRVIAGEYHEDASSSVLVPPHVDALDVGLVLSPKGKKVIEDVRKDLLQQPMRILPRDVAPPKAGHAITATLRGISVNQRKVSHVVSARHEIWTTKLRQEMAQLHPPPPPAST
ncbi:hypothetical protein SPRG_17691 [Saprolegnia parasitica CBS 223.65]|uniref:B box-type domain-containing protein n=1 Tax=Saprolegnia parasitica (strain CBS 223.65) TaxID=695850 RepID=A0A067BEL8_SAPPC|nr:hypothetical protein SPRG_17691 [Saprolegnia parasitica CBS 223.65]KDO16824.1 hypothetical protein SPRG_17691 [Saprolegnia parasitica CBS 223.65]|eukprot:XP_012212467.1 hypothetical protein SPRG_17691 [Saprolegnia parasitica CBS 223.65]